ncbi:MAG: ABC transporter substrate-binding protein [Lachnospiraceae bacterium]|nr:ABC transporter substrate-binding protein [Lachnospiraceae bacterium]
MKENITERRKLALIAMVLLMVGAIAVMNGKKSEEETSALHIGSLKGPTSMGLLYLMEESEEGKAENAYHFTMATTADELLPLMVKGELDIALVPANVASILYNKTEGGITVIDVNTLGVLYMVSGDTALQSISDLKGKTIYLTGRGTTPDYVLQYLLKENGLSAEDCALEYKSEATEVAALLAENPDAIGLLPQPFVTAACAQNEKLNIVLDMTAEWDKVQGESGSRMVTGVTVVRNQILEDNEKAVKTFLAEHAESTAAINDNPEAGAKLVVEAGIVAKEPIAQKAIPYCYIVSITGTEMQQSVSAYLQVLYEQSPDSVGGSLPGEDFYYCE